MDPDVVIKACEVTVFNPKTSSEERKVIKTSPSKNQQALFEGMFVKQCDPKKDTSCPIQIGNNFYKQCDPEKDDKCELDLDKLLFG